VIVAAPVLACAFHLVARFLQNRDAVDVLGVWILFLILAAGMTIPLRRAIS
jgi:hypothetical protein